MIDDSNKGLDSSRVRRRCDATELNFETTTELETFMGMLGQSRAEEALRFGVGIHRRGFNVFVLGPPGMGKHRLVRNALANREHPGEVPTDWVYVHRFDDADRPQAIALPPGRGAKLERAVRALVEDLEEALRGAFESDEYRSRKRAIEAKVESLHEAAFSVLAEEAKGRGLRLLRTPQGLAFAPLLEGEVIDPATFAKLPEKQQEAAREELGGMEPKLRALMLEVPGWKRSAREELREVERELARHAISFQLRELRESFADCPRVTEWLSKLEDDAVQHARLFLGSGDNEEEGSDGAMKQVLREQIDPVLRYRVNLFVDRRGLTAAPIIDEDHPTVDRLFGRVERRAHLGALVSDFTMIKPGALHRANGGTLILDARRLLQSPATWDSLKRALTRSEIEIEQLGRALGMSTSSLEPDAIPLDVKVILIGSRHLYYTLSGADPDFDQLFKVAADFEDDIPWDEENVRRFACLIAGIVEHDGLLPLDAAAVGRAVEEAARWSGDRRKLSTGITRLADLLTESDWCARERGGEMVTRADVRSAIDARRLRGGRFAERTLERFDDGTVHVATSGEVVGQINGLSVLRVGHAQFGQPNRITATVRLGKGEVVDIERESELGGAAHTKGVMILSSFLASRYGTEVPLSMTASLVFEQSYGGVDGDSASMAELCVLLSALSEIPLRQSLAITGSVDQKGRAQVVGGVNEKIEGFFAVCADRGLDGSHGVLVPEVNVNHLMLREEVAEAVGRGDFHIHTMATLDDALELLTGRPAPEVHAAVTARLAELSRRALAHEHAKKA